MSGILNLPGLRELDKKESELLTGIELVTY